MKQINVLLIEDHFLARIALHSVLGGHGQIQIIGEATDGESGLKLCRQLSPDVVVLDLRLPLMSGFELIVQLRKERPGIRIVVLSNYGGSEDIYRAARSGATAYLTKDVSGSNRSMPSSRFIAGSGTFRMSPSTASPSVCRLSILRRAKWKFSTASPVATAIARLPKSSTSLRKLSAST